MIRLFPMLLACTAVAAGAQTASAPLAGERAAPRPLNADEHAALRCAAAFALVSAGQAKGDPAVAAWPVLGTRGREFFVRTGARLMDDAGLDEAGVAAAARAEVAQVRRTGTEPLRPFCVPLLDALVPPKR